MTNKKPSRTEEIKISMIAWSGLWDEGPSDLSGVDVTPEFRAAYDTQTYFFGQSFENTDKMRAKYLFENLLKVYWTFFHGKKSMMDKSYEARTHDMTTVRRFIGLCGEAISIERSQALTGWWLDAFDWIEDRGTRLTDSNRRAWFNLIVSKYLIKEGDMNELF
jgi:hypothetical protein